MTLSLILTVEASCVLITEIGDPLIPIDHQSSSEPPLYSVWSFLEIKMSLR